MNENTILLIFFGPLLYFGIGSFFAIYRLELGQSGITALTGCLFWLPLLVRDVGREVWRMLKEE